MWLVVGASDHTLIRVNIDHLSVHIDDDGCLAPRPFARRASSTALEVLGLRRRRMLRMEHPKKRMVRVVVFTPVS